MGYNKNSTETKRDFLRRYGEQEWLNSVPGEEIAVRFHSSETLGRFSIMESKAQPGAAPPMHLHRDEEEVFHILQGELDFSVAGIETTLKAGDMMRIPAGMPHAWRNRTDHVALMIVMFAPGGPEKIFEMIAGRSNDEISAILDELGTVVVGPPMEA